MLLRFSATNFLSIRERAELSFVATSLKEHATELIPSRYARHGVLPVIAIYGANASGKSNLLIGLSRLRSLVLKSFELSDDDGLNYSPFCLDEISSTEPTRFELDFELENTRYQFGLAYVRDKVISEWLYAFPNKVQQVLYRRDAESDPKYYFGRALGGSNRQIESITSPGTLFISAAAKSGHLLLSKISDFFKTRIRVQLSSMHMPPDILAEKIEQTPELKDELGRYLGFADTGVSTVRVDVTPIPEAEREQFTDLLKALGKWSGSSDPLTAPEVKHALKLGHTSEDGKVRFIEFAAESLGTRYLVGLLPTMLETLRKGGALVLDEITLGLHTLLAQRLVTLFNNRHSNANGAQLIFTTHDTNLLSPGLLRRDEILLSEKSSGGASEYFPLSDIKTKNTDNLERGYIQGRFGGIPFLEEIPA